MDEQQRYENFIKGLLKFINKLDNKAALFIHLHRKLYNNFDDVQLAPVLFVPIMESLYVDLVISLAKLYEQGSTRNLNKFLNFVESNQHKIRWNGEGISQQKLSEHKQLLESEKSAISHVLAQRNKYFAHHDCKYFTDSEKINDDYPVTIDDFRRLIEVAWKIINEHSFALNKFKMISQSPWYVISLEQIFEKLQELNKTNTKEFIG